MPKYLISILLMSVIHISIKAQTSFSSDFREYCAWNKSDKKFESCKAYEESSLFVMNDDETMFIHTSESKKVTYFVKNKEYDKQRNIFSYNVVSDIGYETNFMFDIENSEIRTLVVYEGDFFLLRFYIKAIF